MKISTVQFSSPTISTVVHSTTWAKIYNSMRVSFMSEKIFEKIRMHMICSDLILKRLSMRMYLYDLIADLKSASVPKLRADRRREEKQYGEAWPLGWTLGPAGGSGPRRARAGDMGDGRHVHSLNEYPD